jgi:hypothetical protein
VGRNDNVVTKQEAMKILKKSRATIHRLLADGSLVKARFPGEGKTYITVDSIHRYQVSSNKSPLGGTPLHRRKELSKVLPWVAK